MPGIGRLAMRFGFWIGALGLVEATSSAGDAVPKPVPAFPGAEGAGMGTVGGRGGRVFVVTSLADRGPGTLREAVEAEGPRTVVFGVAGPITLESPLDIANPRITIAGQSAPGDGVCVRGRSVHVNTSDVIIRYMRFRRGDLRTRDDALGGYPIKNLMIDHVSASWGLDENLSMYRYIENIDGQQIKRPLENVTIQWSISSEALNPNNHAFGGTWDGEPGTFHHNLFACNTGRNPSIGMSGMFDFRNNVLFNWRHRTIDGADGASRINIVANYFKAGPATPKNSLQHRICRVEARGPRYENPGLADWYVAENYVEGYPEITADNWKGGVNFSGPEMDKDVLIPMGSEAEVRASEPFPAPSITQQSAEDAYRLVLAIGGASLPRRDAVDARVMESVRTGRPTFGDGIIKSPADVGGWPEYRSDAIPPDADRDGMSDAWESAHGLDPADPADASKDADRDGYTAIEEFLNGTDPTAFVDYTRPENNRNTLHDHDGGRR